MWKGGITTKKWLRKCSTEGSFSTPASVQSVWVVLNNRIFYNVRERERRLACFPMFSSVWAGGYYQEMGGFGLQVFEVSWKRDGKFVRL